MAFHPETQAQQEDFLQKTQTFQNNQQAILDKLHILHEQLRSLHEIPDKVQRQQAFQQLQVEWIHLQQSLLEQQHLLREQQAAYRDLRLDFEAQHALLHAEKQVIQQRQQERRWQGYGDSWQERHI